MMSKTSFSPSFSASRPASYTFELCRDGLTLALRDNIAQSGGEAYVSVATRLDTITGGRLKGGLR